MNSAQLQNHHSRTNPEPGMPDSYIEPRIRPLVDTLNRTGQFQVSHSCEDHADRAMVPYLAFSADPQAAAALEQAIREASARSRWNALWEIQGHFNNNCQLRYILRCCLLGSWICDLRKLHQDLDSIREVVATRFGPLAEQVKANPEKEDSQRRQDKKYFERQHQRLYKFDYHGRPVVRSRWFVDAAPRAWSIQLRVAKFLMTFSATKVVSV